VVPLHTPFSSGGGVDQDGISRELRYLEDQGIEWVMLMGVTGEWPALHFAERRQIMEVATAARGRLKLIFHVGSVDIDETIELISCAEALSAQAVMLSGPFVQSLSDIDLSAYYKRLAQSTNLPCLIYVNPGATVTHLSAQAIVNLADEPNIIGMKDSVRDPRYLTDVLHHVKQEFSLLCGEGDLLMAWLGGGAQGAMTVPSLIDPARCLQIWRQYKQGHLSAALQIWREVFSLVEALGTEGRYLPMMKVALQLQGRPAGRCRPPLEAEPSPEAKEKLAVVMHRLELISGIRVTAR
jgi:4-hydroxy-tetrahydrodipicolinate synthase